MHLFISLALLLGTSMGQKQLCGREQGQSSNGYRLQNNLYAANAGHGSQCSTIDEVNDSGISWHTTWQWSGGRDTVKSYSYSALEKFTKKPVSKISSMPTTVKWNVDNRDTRSDISYDFFTAQDVNHAPSSGDYELMIWLDRYGGIKPIGDKVTTVKIGDHSWDLYIGPNGNMTVFSFLASKPIPDFSSDVIHFFDYLESNQSFPASSQNLLSFQFGTEPFTGSKTTLTVSKWTAEVN